MVNLRYCAKNQFLAHGYRRTKGPKYPSKIDMVNLVDGSITSKKTPQEVAAIPGFPLTGLMAILARVRHGEPQQAGEKNGGIGHLSRNSEQFMTEPK